MSVNAEDKSRDLLRKAVEALNIAVSYSFKQIRCCCFVSVHFPVNVFSVHVQTCMRVCHVHIRHCSSGNMSFCSLVRIACVCFQQVSESNCQLFVKVSKDDVMQLVGKSLICKKEKRVREGKRERET